MLYVDNQHVLLKMLIGGNYTLPIKEHLSYQPGTEKSIFDLGCGTGAWCARFKSWPKLSAYKAGVGQWIWLQSFLTALSSEQMLLRWILGQQYLLKSSITDFDAYAESGEKTLKSRR